MSIVGIGTDIVETVRLERMQSDHGERLAARLLASGELAGYRSALSAGPSAAAAFLARRFAAKEAAAKALGCGIGSEAGFHDLRVSHDRGGAPVLTFHGPAARRAGRLGIQTAHLSISDERHYAVAMVVLER
ncbi:holo-ACP synthase [Spiribacter insolitus]|uniref:Holo-[acyl-carrier-protein] synthase n=1 Tax=Spiribacter insolitus TaxID=3122417 RepID=A0ABV3T553_9GAMM